MSRATAVARPSIESAVAATSPPVNQENRERRRLIDVSRQSRPCQDAGQRQLSLRSAASPHPDCRAVLIQIVARYLMGSSEYIGSFLLLLIGRHMHLFMQ